jgi:endonuclease YncB( thermonuclease family)
MQRPPEYPDNEPPEEIDDDDLVNKVYGPSQNDIDRSWEGYESGHTVGGRSVGGMVWKVAIVVVSLVILASLSLGVLSPLFGGDDSPQERAPEWITATVLRVIDGRTIVISSGYGEQTVRLIGIESPPFGHPFYDFAGEVTQAWIDGKTVMLEADQLDSDDQGRLMRYVFLDNIMINAALILNGLGTAESVQPNIRYSDYLTEMERQARGNKVGIWDEAFGDLDAEGREVSIRTNSAPKWATS